MKNLLWFSLLGLLTLFACDGWDDDIEYYPESSARAAIVFEDRSLSDSIQYQIGVINGGSLSRNALGGVSALDAVVADGKYFWVVDINGVARRYALGDSASNSSVNFQRRTQGAAVAIGRRWLMVGLNRENSSTLIFARRSNLDKQTDIALNDRVLSIDANMDEFYVYGQDSLYVVNEAAKTIYQSYAYPQQADAAFGGRLFRDNGLIEAGFLGVDGNYFRTLYNPVENVFSSVNISAGSDQFVSRENSGYFEAAYETELQAILSYNADSSTTLTYNGALPRYVNVTEAPILGVDFLRSIGFHRLETDTANYLLVDDYKDAAPADTFRLPPSLRPLRVVPLGVQ